MLGVSSSTVRRPSSPVASGSPRSSRTQSTSPEQREHGLGQGAGARSSSMSEPASSNSSRTRKASPSSSSTSSTAHARLALRPANRAPDGRGELRLGHAAERSAIGAGLSGHPSAGRASAARPSAQTSPSRRARVGSGSDVTVGTFARTSSARIPGRLGGRPTSNHTTLPPRADGVDAPGSRRAGRACAVRGRWPTTREPVQPRRHRRPVGDLHPHDVARSSTTTLISLRACSTALVTTSETSRTTVSTSHARCRASCCRANRRASGTLSVVGGSRARSPRAGYRASHPVGPLSDAALVPARCVASAAFAAAIRSRRSVAVQRRCLVRRRRRPPEPGGLPPGVVRAGGRSG